ncbi:uncharacterized protein LOC141588756 [Silene latifolia]|uniref:uncharacterized protein LOC141588756 n=1 Tax=Silene latifolia TaxID=37657 RepID=UPI003D785522
MGDPVPIRETMAPKHIVNPSIQRPQIQANNFEIKNALLNLIQDNQFRGGPLENPNDDLNDFLENCDMYKSNGVSDDVVRLRLFPRSLRGSGKGTLDILGHKAAKELIEEMASRTMEWGSDRQMRKGKSKDSNSVLNVEVKGMLDELTQQVALLNSKPPSSDMRQVLSCELCGEQGHTPIGCPLISPLQEECWKQFVTQHQQPFGGFKGQNFNQQQNQNFQTPQKSSWEQAFEQLVIANQKSDSKLDNHIPSQNRVNDEIRASQKATETHLAQISQQLGQLAQNPGKFPGNTVNPREMNAVFLRSGKQLEEIEKSPKWKRKRVTNEVVKEHPVEVVEEDKIRVEKSKEVEMVDPPKQDEPIATKAKECTPPPREYVAPVPFPQRLARPRIEKKYEKFVEILKGMNVTIPFLDMITKIPSYDKFLKELVTLKKKNGEVQTINLSKECSAILTHTNKLPNKLEDPGSFSIPCSIQGVAIKRALCDLGASVSLMPLSIFKRLDLGDLKPTRVSLQLADRSVKFLIGVIEDVPLVVGKLVIPCDFFVMDMPEDYNVPIILGRPCLATGGAMIDVKSGKLSLQVGEDRVEFELHKSMEAPSLGDTCCIVDILENPM